MVEAGTRYSSSSDGWSSSAANELTQTVAGLWYRMRRVVVASWVSESTAYSEQDS